MLAIFLKYPTVGKVKTRVAQDTDEHTACQIYKLLAEEVVESLGQFQPTLHYDGCSVEQMQQWLPSLDYQVQGEGHLGERLMSASQQHFSRSNDKLIIIGTDCIEINVKIIKQTLDMLDNNDLVVGPTNDGGYYLIAIKAHYSTLFEDIDWSTNKVLEQTLTKSNKLGLMHKLLAKKCDIDYWHQVPQKYKKIIGKY